MTLKPCIKTDLSNYDYHNDPYYRGLSSSLIKEFRKSPLHCFAKMVSEPEEPTPAMIFGKLFHWLVLEPVKFNGKAVEWTGGRKAGKEWKEFKEQAGDRIVVSKDDMDTLYKMMASIQNNETATALLKNGHAEESFFWKDQRGFMCKCRTDYRKPSLGIIVDLKTAADASPEGFSKACANFGYDIQASWYQNGLYQATKEFYRNFIFVVVEKKPPYAVGVYRASQEMVDNGGGKISPMLDDYAECLKSGKWPGYTDGITDLYLPKWALTN